MCEHERERERETECKPAHSLVTSITYSAWVFCYSDLFRHASYARYLTPVKCIHLEICCSTWLILLSPCPWPHTAFSLPLADLLSVTRARLNIVRLISPSLALSLARRRSIHEVLAQRLRGKAV